MLARKSRKQLQDKTAKESIYSEKPYSAAGYIRLSVAKTGQVADSIENQKKIIEQYLESQSDIILDKFYVDENVSGTVFERKAFQTMLKDIENNKINCVIVRDLSRLGRSFIETGYYIERDFPRRGVRFISVGDRFDTLDGVTNISFSKMSGIRIPITNVFNEKMVDDIRVKTQSSIDSNTRKGECVAPRAPYGYKKAVGDCHKLIPDTEAAAVVTNIFDMASKQIGMNEIVRRLNISKIPTPIDYTRTNGLQGIMRKAMGFGIPGQSNIF